jgi:hypothetical protein
MSRVEDETPAKRAARLELQKLTAEIGNLIAAALPARHIGFALVLFDFAGANDGSMAYAATGQREDLVKMFRELADKLDVDAQAKSIAFRDPRSS